MSRSETLSAKRIIRSEMVRRDVSYQELADRLAEAGEDFSEAALRNKVSRGSFTADFFLSVLAVMNVDTLRLTD
jgi:hypothetical protein